MRNGVFVLSLCCLTGMVQSVRADVFAYTDAEGTTHYTNEPTGKKFTKVVEAFRQPQSAVPFSDSGFKGKASTYAQVIEEVALDIGVDQALVHAVITAESCYDPAAVSKAGAKGMMQLMPDTAKRYGVKNPLDANDNIRGGVRYLRDLLDMFDNDLELAVAAYNSGENAVMRHGMQVPPYKETRAYVPKILRIYKQYAAQRP